MASERGARLSFAAAGPDAQAFWLAMHSAGRSQFIQEHILDVFQVPLKFL